MTPGLERLNQHFLLKQAELINLSHDGIITTDIGRLITGWNAGAEEIYGWPAPEVLGRCAWDLLKTEAPLPQSEIDDILQRTGHWDGELVQTRRDGQRVVVESRQVLVADANGADGVLQVNRDITERKRFEGALKESEEWFRLLFEEGPVAAAIVGPDLTFHNVNRAFSEMLGYGDRELQGKNIADVTHPDDVDSSIECARRLSAGQIPRYELEKRYISKTGEYIWGHLTVAAIRDPNGRIVSHLGIIENITGRKRAQMELQRSEEHFRFLADSIPHLVWAASPDGSVEYHNARALEYMGAPSEALAGSGWINYIHPDDAERMSKLWRAAVAGGREHRAEIRIRRASDGAWRWHLARTMPQRDSQGRIVRWFGTATDIDDLRAAEAALRDSEERYRLLTESVPEIIFTAMPNIGNEYCNRRWYEYTGLTLEQTTGKGWLQVVHPEDRERARAEWLEATRTGRNFEIEYRLRRSDGVYRWFRGHAQPVRDAAGNVVKWFGICVDIDDQKRQEESLRQTQKLESIGLLASGIAHDFNNLLAVIIGNASLILPHLREDDAQRLESVIRAGEKGSELTRQLLAYAGRGRLIVEDMDVSAEMRGIVDLMRFSVPKKVELRFALAGDLPAIKADRSQVQQVAMNLIINGAEAIGDNNAGVVTLRTGLRHLGAVEAGLCTQGVEKPSPGDYVCIEVTDSGSGMDTATKARIFDPFFSTKFLGRGLGLSAVSGIVRSNGGFIEVDSAPGKGSVFRIYLPVAGPPARAVEPQKPQPEAETLSSGTVLVVDDDPGVRHFVADALRHYGYRVLQAADGKSALTIFENYADRISAVFLDLVMPVLGGDEIIADLHRKSPDVKIILTSGYDRERAERLVGKGLFAAFLQKPYTAAHLAEAVRKAMAVG
jgi:two-component system cell cycle sensor histidine kinase/response regulator CckA